MIYLAIYLTGWIVSAYVFSISAKAEAGMGYVDGYVVDGFIAGLTVVLIFLFWPLLLPSSAIRYIYGWVFGR